MELTKEAITNCYKILEKHFHKQFALASCETDYIWCNLKYIHSIDVYIYMTRLLQNDKILSKLQEENKIRLQIAALLHDLGRFYQMENGKILRHLNHGDMAKKILIDDEKFDDEYILLFIKLHEGRFKIEDEPFFQSLNNEEKEFARLGLKATEDSDIIANFQKMRKDNQLFSFDEITFEPIISDEIFNAILEGRHFNGFLLSRSIYDSLLMRICLVRLLSFKYSKQICNNIGFAKFLLSHVDNFKEKTLKQKLATKEQLDEIDQKLDIVKNCLKNNGFEI